MTNTATATQSSCTGSVSAEPKTAVIASPVNVTMNPMQKLLMMVPSPMYRRPKSSCGTKGRVHQHILDAERQPTSSANRRFSALMESLPRRENLNTAMPMPMMTRRNHAKDAPQGDFLAEKIHVQNAFLITIRILYSTIP